MGVPSEGSRSCSSCLTGSPPQEARGTSQLQEAKAWRRCPGVEGAGAAGQAKPGVRPKICPRGSLQRPLPSPGWPQFTRLPAHPCRPPGTGCLSPTLRAAQCTELGSGQTHGRRLPCQHEAVPPLHSWAQGWVGQGGGGRRGALGDTEPHTRRMASRVKTQLHSRRTSPAHSFGACKTCTFSPGSKRDMETCGRPPGERPLPSLQESGACLVISVLPTEVGLKVHGPEEETGNQRTELGFEPTWERKLSGQSAASEIPTGGGRPACRAS